MVFKAPGDPRRPAEARKYERPMVKDEDQSTDLIALVALIFGMGAVTFKIKVCSWISLLCCVSSLCTMKGQETDAKQVVTSITFAMLGLVSSYLSPQKPKSAA
mmetsp:Transcript_35092/g.99527  ORF Transcript_35092/g.99527 Transcript_35092/m.99527 type:complete len:103 (-) Transcript_35092:207-515(-)|eukprot:CAMPEP_0117670184 /NCGR_PEP_ID=MMETSP0804-20121206/12594_1 /TAXON_ID=1074897 /ORGANISM="Tetraselmis astigmatica, Strain CCMP880" /LENGTH=102 /DNA_ID=CAMNT_0005478419 /DNA_START=106 /DNA_END=414 /DNA_ORIENTATION=+